jgi:hypothetical protein
MRISRARVRPSDAAIKRRVELLPQSKAATASLTNVHYAKRRHVKCFRDELADRVGRAREIVREVRVKTLHPDAGATDAAAGLNEFCAQRRGVATTRVLLVRTGQFIGIDELLEAVHATVALEAAHRRVELGVDEPVQGGHRRAVAQVRLVLNDDGRVVESAYHDRETTSGGTTEQRFDDRLIVEGRVAKAQRQNSKVRTSREK